MIGKEATRDFDVFLSYHRTDSSQVPAWVDFRTARNPWELLIWGITGRRPAFTLASRTSRASA